MVRALNALSSNVLPSPQVTRSSSSRPPCAVNWKDTESPGAVSSLSAWIVMASGRGSDPYELHANPVSVKARSSAWSFMIIPSEKPATYSIALAQPRRQRTLPKPTHLLIYENLATGGSEEYRGAACSSRARHWSGPGHCACGRHHHWRIDLRTTLRDNARGRSIHL